MNFSGVLISLLQGFTNLLKAFSHGENLDLNPLPSLVRGKKSVTNLYKYCFLSWIRGSFTGQGNAMVHIDDLRCLISIHTGIHGDNHSF